MRSIHEVLHDLIHAAAFTPEKRQEMHDDVDKLAENAAPAEEAPVREAEPAASLSQPGLFPGEHFGQAAPGPVQPAAGAPEPVVQRPVEAPERVTWPTAPPERAPYPGEHFGQAASTA